MPALAALMIAQSLFSPGLHLAEDTAAAIPAGAAPMFGMAGAHAWDNYAFPYCGCEPTMGVDWVHDDGKTALYQAYDSTLHVTWDDTVPVGTTPPATMTDVTSSWNNLAGNLDPIMYTDFDGGRAFTGGISGTTCGNLSYTDDNGATWNPMVDPCALPQFDHETVSAGPYFGLASPPYAVYPRITYYCAQLPQMNCWESWDGGITFHQGGQPDSTASCGGLHGHMRISRVDGTAYLPNKWCSGMTAYSYTQDDGLTWNLVTLADTHSGFGHFDPSIAPTLDSGWLYFGQGEDDGAYIALTKDNGLTWEDVGTGNGAPAGTKYFNVGSLVGVNQATFADVIAGDDDRAAFAFVGSPNAADYDSCSGAADAHEFWLYVAWTFDAGKTWSVEKASLDPMQRGGIWPYGGGASCRNLLDFNDIVTDKFGRVLVAFTDGCTGTCATATGTVSSPGARDVIATIARQTTGKGVLSAYDFGVVAPPGPKTVAGSITPSYPDSKPIPMDGQMPPNDADGDGLNDAADNCASDPNDGQGDLDGDGTGDACDTDIDGDGVANLDDNCATAGNSWQEDLDADLLGDPCDPDADGDGIANTGDDCAFDADAAQLDQDQDGLGDVCDEDRDGDGYVNSMDAFPDDATRWEKVPDVALPASQAPSHPVAAAVPVKAESGGAFPVVPVTLGAAAVLLAVAGLIVLLVRRRHN